MIRFYTKLLALCLGQELILRGLPWPSDFIDKATYIKRCACGDTTIKIIDELNNSCKIS